MNIKQIAIASALLSVTALSHGQTETVENSEDITLGRQYLQCTSFWGIAPPILKALGQNVDTNQSKKIRELNQIAAYVLMGEDRATAENDVEKIKFLNDMKSMGASKALDKWSKSCDSLMEATFKSILPRIEAYAKVKAQSKAQ